MTYRSVVTIREKTTMKNIYQFAAWIGSEIDGINDEKFMAAAWILCAWMRREVIDCIPLPEFPATVSGSTKKRTVCCGDLPAGGTLFHPSFLCI